MTRLRHIDGLRGVAIVAVILFHFCTEMLPPKTAEQWVPYGDTLAQLPWIEFGRYGVQLFFIISGFVIALTLQRCASWQIFASARVRRLWPTLVVAGLLSYAVVLLFASGSEFDHGPSSVLMTSFLIPPALTQQFGLDVAAADPVVWSLLVEVQFYIVAALLYFWRRPSPSSFLTRLVIVAVALTTLRVVLVAVAVQNPDQASTIISPLLVFALPHYIWWFVGGAALYQLMGNGDRRHAIFVAVTAVIGQLFATLVIDPSGAALSSTAAITTTLIVCGLFLSALYLKPLQWALTRRPVLFLGSVSYPLYLIHMVIGLVLLRFLGNLTGWTGLPAVGLLIVVFGLLVALAWVLHKTIETRQFGSGRNKPPTEESTSAPAALSLH